MMIEKQNKKPSYWLKAVSHLRSNDPVLSSLINKHRSKIYLVSVNSVFITLIKIIKLIVKFLSKKFLKLENYGNHIVQSLHGIYGEILMKMLYNIKKF
jgi:hypothetical protein